MWSEEEPGESIRRFSDSGSPFHAKFLSFEEERAGHCSNSPPASPRRGKQPAIIMPEDSAQVGAVWRVWKQREQAVSSGVVKRQLTRSLSKQSNLIRNHVSSLQRTTSRRDIFQKTFSPSEEALIQDNLGTLTVAIDEVLSCWKKNEKDSSLQEGRIVAVLTNLGSIADWSHHIFPVPETPGITKPDLFSDELFESWWKTSEVWKEFVRANEKTAEFAKEFAPIPAKRASQKFPQGTLEAIGVASEVCTNVVLVEFIISINDEGEFSWCMIGLYEDSGLPKLSFEQSRILLETINRLNSSGATAMRKRENGYDFTPYRRLGLYRMSSLVITPLYFQFLEWALAKGSITKKQFLRKNKFAMAMVLPYLQALHEHAMSPLNLGLRALMLPTPSSLENSKFKG